MTETGIVSLDFHSLYRHTNLLQLTWTSLVLYAPVASLTKISICLTYLRVFPLMSDRRFAQFGIAFSVIYCVVTTLLNVLQCW